jgi:cyanophycinase
MVLGLAAAARGAFPELSVEKTRPQGALLIIGGGVQLDPIYDAFYELAGGDAARIAYIPTATQYFEELVEDPNEFRVWRERPSESFTFVHTRDRHTAEAHAFAEPVRRATGAWIGGGSQAKLTEIYGDTPLMSELHALVARGGVVAGNSAGASIMSQIMIADQHERGIVAGQGFALCPATVIDCHFSERRRVPRLLRMLEAYPDHSGIGIDEDTALLVQGDRAIVIGKGSVTFFARRPGSSDISQVALRAGEKYDLRNLRESPESVELAKE